MNIDYCASPEIHRNLLKLQELLQTVNKNQADMTEKLLQVAVLEKILTPGLGENIDMLA